MNYLAFVLACLRFLLLPLLFVFCARGEQVPPREWPVAEADGIRPESFALEGKVHEDEPSIAPWSLLNFITPHADNRVTYENGERCYRGSGHIGHAAFQDSFIIGYPICAFSYRGEFFLISQFPSYKPDSSRFSCGYHLYILHNGRLRELVSNRSKSEGLSRAVRTPGSFNALRHESMLPDRGKLLDVLSRLQFTEPHLNYFAANWYFVVTNSCIFWLDDAEDDRRFKQRMEFYRSGRSRHEWNESDACKAQRAQDQAYAIREMTSLVEYLEEASSSHPEIFAPNLARLLKEGYLFSPGEAPGEPICPSFDYLPMNESCSRMFSVEAPAMQSLLRRLRCCWVSLLAKAAKGELIMTPQCVLMYQNNLLSIDGYLLKSDEHD